MITSLPRSAMTQGLYVLIAIIPWVTSLVFAQSSLWRFRLCCGVLYIERFWIRGQARADVRVWISTCSDARLHVEACKQQIQFAGTMSGDQYVFAIARSRRSTAYLHLFWGRGV